MRHIAVLGRTTQELRVLVQFNMKMWVYFLLLPLVTVHGQCWKSDKQTLICCTMASDKQSLSGQQNTLVLHLQINSNNPNRILWSSPES